MVPPLSAPDLFEPLPPRTDTHLESTTAIHCHSLPLTATHCLSLSLQLLRSSLLSLSRKVLTYREIDTSLAVACLVMLPYDAMVRELKAAVPSIQVRAVMTT